MECIWVRADWITGAWLAASLAEFIPHGLARVTLEACDTWATKALTCCGVTCLIVGAEWITFASFTASTGLDIPVAVLALIATSVFDVGPALTLSGVEVTLQWLVKFWLLMGSEWVAVTGVAFLGAQGITPVPRQTALAVVTCCVVNTAATELCGGLWVAVADGVLVYVAVAAAFLACGENRRGYGRVEC